VRLFAIQLCGLAATPDVKRVRRNMALKRGTATIRATADQNVQSNSKAKVAKVADDPCVERVENALESAENQTCQVCDDNGAGAVSVIEQDGKSAAEERHDKLEERSGDELESGNLVAAVEEEMCAAGLLQVGDSDVVDAVGACGQEGAFQSQEGGGAGVDVGDEDDNEECSNESEGFDDKCMIYCHHDDIDPEAVRAMPLPIKPKAQVGAYIPPVIGPDEHPHFATNLNFIGNTVVASHPSSAAGNPEIKHAFSRLPKSR
jgi:hypothetical protein